MIDPSQQSAFDSVRLVTSPEDLSRAFEIRKQVFVEEQHVPFEEELDAYDALATHFLVERSGDVQQAIATARLIDKGRGVGKVGRVAVLAEFRGRGVGAALMRFIEAYAQAQGYLRLILEAQVQAIPFYSRLEYVAEGPVFLDAGIEHRLMSKSLVDARHGH